MQRFVSGQLINGSQRRGGTHRIQADKRTRTRTTPSRQIRACDLCALCVIRPDFTHEAIGTEHGLQVTLLLQLATVGPHA